MFRSSRSVRWMVWLSFALAAAPTPSVSGEDTLEERRQRLLQLAEENPAKLEDLQRKRERFEKLSAEEQARLRRMHEQLNAAPDADRLKRLLAAYTDWLKTLTAAERTELKQLSGDQRIARIRELKQKQEAQNFGWDTQLPPQDFATIFTWVVRYVARHEDEILARLPRQLDEQLRKAPPVRRHRMLLVALVRRQGGFEAPMPDAEEIRELQSQLSPKAQEILAAETDPRRKANLVRRWIQAAVQARLVPHLTDEKLQTFFETKLTQQQRDGLDRLPAEQRNQQLRRLYYQHFFQRLASDRVAPDRRGPAPRGGPRPRDDRPKDSDR